MFYMYNSLVAFKIPPFLQAEASFLRYSASARRKNSPPPLSKKAIPVADPGEGPVGGGGGAPHPHLF